MIFTDLAPYEALLKSRDLIQAEAALTKPKRSTPSSRQNRSYLMLSANRPKHLNKLDTLTADNIMINLEDGVAPEEKQAARYLAAIFLTHVTHTHARLIVRINPLGEGGEEDIKLLNRAKPDAIRIPKIRTADDVHKACALIDEGIDVHLSIETKEAFQAIASLKISPRVTTFYLGILDLLAELSLPQNGICFGNPVIDYLLGKFLLDSRCVEAEAVFFTYQDYTKKESFRHWCKKAQAMGYRGTSCISPDQVAIAHEVFGLDKKSLEEARYIIKRFEMMAAEGITGFTDERFGFIDEPIYKGALALIKGS